MSEREPEFNVKFHERLGGTRDNHPPYNWVVATGEDIYEIGDLGPKDLYKTALAKDTGGIYTLVSVDPATWVVLEGRDGEERPKWDTGPAGPRGTSGSDGERGDRGPVGPAGPVGLRGPQGDRGERGEKGDTGPRGYTGAAGNDGPTGPTGPRGPQGERGPTGLTGPKGDDGPEGPQGPPGMEGPKGEVGERGISLLEGSSYEMENHTSDHTRMLNLVRSSGVSGMYSMANASRGVSVSGDYSMSNSTDNATIAGRYCQVNASKSVSPINISANTECSQVNASTGLATIDMSSGTLSANSGTTNRRPNGGSQINASNIATIYSLNAQVNASNDVRIRTSFSQINASHNCEISDAGTNSDYSQINASRGVLVESDQSYCSVWGWSTTTTPRTTNQRIRLESRNGMIRAANTTVQGFDYAEYFKNASPGEVALGTIMTLDGESVRPATSDDDAILGTITATAGVIGNAASLCWQGRYLKDEFGQTLTETIDWVRFEEVDYDTGQLITYDGPLRDAPPVPDGAVYSKEEIPLENPDYDPDQQYENRDQRPDQWSLVSLLGQIYVRVYQDLKENDYVSATGHMSEVPTRLKVMSMHRSYEASKGYAVAKCLLR